MCGICGVCTVLCMLRGQRKILGVLLCHGLSYYFDTVSLTDPETKLMAAKPSDPPVSTSPSALEFQTCAWPCLTLHMGSGTQTQTFTLCNKHSYPLLSISRATIFFSVLGSIIHFWTAGNSEVRTYSYSLNVLVKISPHSGSRSVIMMCWRKSFGHIYRILYMETNTRISESLTHFFFSNLPTCTPPSYLSLTKISTLALSPMVKASPGPFPVTLRCTVHSLCFIMLGFTLLITLGIVSLLHLLTFHIWTLKN